MTYGFFALISRLKNIDRWALMRNSDRENVQEHSHMTAVLAHALAVIRRDVYGIPCDPDNAAAAALFHDATEIFTGDMPTPVKYYDDGITGAYKRIEEAAASRLTAALPEAMAGEYGALLRGGKHPDIVKAADKLSAYVKCLEELKSGNGEFRSAAESTLEKLKGLEMPEVDYFLEHFIAAFDMTLDELEDR